MSLLTLRLPLRRINVVGMTERLSESIERLEKPPAIYVLIGYENGDGYQEWYEGAFSSQEKLEMYLYDKYIVHKWVKKTGSVHYKCFMSEKDVERGYVRRNYYMSPDTLDSLLTA